MGKREEIGNQGKEGRKRGRDKIIKNPPTMQETWVPSQGWEDPLEKGTTTHSSILAWRTPWTEETGKLQSMGLQRRTQLSDFHFLHCLLTPSLHI